MSYYVVVRGPLGVGKTTISRALAKSLQGEVVSIDPIADPQWDGGSVRLYVRANGVAARQARRGLARGKPVVIDGCFYWKTQIKDLERRLPFDHAVITLQAPLSICVARDSQRKVAFGPEAARAVYRKITRFEYGIPVDATQPVGRVVRKISSLLPTSR